MRKAFSVLFLLGISLLIACTEDSDSTEGKDWSGKILVINEGPYQSGTGTISAFDRQTGEVTQDIFNLVNGRPLGNIVESFTVHGRYAYIVVNNANRIEVVDKSSFESLGKIEGLDFPVFLLCLDDRKGYVSCMDGTVKVVDLAALSVTKSIPVGTGPDRMLLAGDLWVIDRGGFTADSTVCIIDTSADTVRRTIVTGHVPCGIVADKDGMIWILCSGMGWNGFPAPTDTPGRLVCYDPSDYSVARVFPFPTSDLHPDNLAINPEGDILYYNHPEGIFAFPVGSNSLPDEPLVKRKTMLYGIGYDPIKDMVMGADAVDYVQNGWAYFYDPASGTSLDSFQTGVIPNGFWTGQ